MLVTDLKENEGILCTTVEKCNKILDLMHDAGLKWEDGRTYKENRRMDYLYKGQVYYPFDGTYGLKETENLLYPASEFIGTKKSGTDCVFKMGDKVLYDGELCYFVKNGDRCYIEKLSGWKRDGRIPEEYISKLGDNYWCVSPSDLYPYEEKLKTPVEEKIFEEKKEDCYPQWVKDLAVEEHGLIGKKPISFKEKGTCIASVWTLFCRSDSRQGHKVRENANKGDYSLLEKRVIDNNWGFVYTDLKNVTSLSQDKTNVPIDLQSKDSVCVDTSAFVTIPNTTTINSCDESVIGYKTYDIKPIPNRIGVDLGKVEPTKIKRFRL